MRSLRFRSGVSRIDLLFATAVVGVIAAIVWGNLQRTRSDAYVDLLKTDLRALQVEEEKYWTQNARYATDAAQLGWKTRPEVTVSLSSSDPAVGFDAEARHSARPGVACRMYVGRAVGRKSGEIDCTRP